MNKNLIEIYTDGSCLKNPGRGAYGAIVINHIENATPVEFLCGYNPETTNNQMEMLAAIKGLEFVQDYITKEDSVFRIVLYTDSQYLKNGITLWIHNWKKNNWRTASKDPVKNQDLWQQLDILNAGLRPEWLWVKAHENNAHNNAVDRIANLCAQRQAILSSGEMKLCTEEFFNA